MGDFFIWIPMLIMLGIATYTDLRWRIIPDKLVVMGLSYFLVLRLLYADQPYINYLIGIVAGAGVLYVFALCRPGSFGGGDIKLLAVVGAAMGWQGSLIFLWIMLGIAGLFTVVLWRKRKLELPLVPFFLVANFVFLVIMAV
ncbi:hypothetical protein ASL14_19110 [Paenibacillus sp. IHB B 3084]|uniref:prepilin peptidase n=1 Tax=Paenibacillus sp. IHB B 3084 TaxID=867076 RepID=UPI000721B3EC|nr:prepilin peptidase [Paenibacillus sp. IHB B 3084]ALP37982.1 hypothetical protein ASL14_19110 [Paenibacillus sp. IHB B 3084]